MFNGMHENTMFTHNICGQTFETTPYKILHRDYHCACELVISRNVAAKRISDRNRFKLKKYTNTRNPVTVMCNKCGAEVQFQDLFSCIKANYCPNCSRKNYYSDKKIHEMVKDLSGNHLSLLDISPGSKVKSRDLTFHCNDCGKTIVIPLDKYLAGQTCICKGKMPYEEFKNYVYVCTGKQYMIGEEVKRKHYEIIHRKSGRIMILSKSVILCEINKKSDSSLLPYSKQNLLANHREMLYSISMIVKEMIKKKKDHFFIRFLKKRTGCSDSDILLGIWHGLFRFDRKRQNVLSLNFTKQLEK